MEREGASGWGVSWLLWTAPYGVVMQVLWNTSWSERWKPIKVRCNVLLFCICSGCQAFKFATRFWEFKDEFFWDPRAYSDESLLIKSLGEAWLLTILSQGVFFGLIQGVLSGENTRKWLHPHLICPFLADFSPDGEILGELTASASMLSVSHLPIELVTLCTISGASNLLTGTLLLTHVYTMNFARSEQICR